MYNKWDSKNFLKNLKKHLTNCLTCVIIIMSGEDRNYSLPMVRLSRRVTVLSANQKVCPKRVRGSQKILKKIKKTLDKRTTMWYNNYSERKKYIKKR